MSIGTRRRTEKGGGRRWGTQPYRAGHHTRSRGKGSKAIYTYHDKFERGEGEVIGSHRAAKSRYPSIRQQVRH